MSTPLKAVFFDVDGVLIDSLPQHLQFCRAKANEFDLKIQIPSVEKFRSLVSSGIKVSPMQNFLTAVGFPNKFLDITISDYVNSFTERYRPKLFPGALLMLKTLKDEGLTLGIVSSNVRSNVLPVLGTAAEDFDRRCLFFIDRYSTPRTKHWCLKEGMRLLNIEPSECAYVGDLPADLVSALEARAEFVAVSYGWGTWDSRSVEVVGSVEALPAAPLKRQPRGSTREKMSVGGRHGR